MSGDMSAKLTLAAILGLFAIYAAGCGVLMLRQAEAMRSADLSVQAMLAEASQATALARQARRLLDPDADRAEALDRFSTLLRGFRSGRFTQLRLEDETPRRGDALNGEDEAVRAFQALMRAAAAIAEKVGADNRDAGSERFDAFRDASRGTSLSPAGTHAAADQEALAQDLEAAARALAFAHRGRLNRERLEASRAESRLRNLALAGLGGGAALFLGLVRFGLAPLARRMNSRADTLESLLARERAEATHDAATGLLNSRGVRERLAKVMAAPDCRPALLHLALDHARLTRGALGADRTDPALRAAARRLAALLRPGETLARVGLGEFIVALDHVAAPSQAEAVARRLIDGMNRTIVEDGEVLSLPVRAGVAVSRQRDRDPDALLSDAALALDEAVRAGDRRCALYAPAIRAAQEARALTAVELAGAFSRGEIVPYFQPQVHLGTGALLGFESLVRWRHPERGVLGPSEFVRIAEETGQIEQMGDVAMRASLAALAEWRNLGLGVHHVAVNVSARELRDPALADKLAWDVDAAGLSPRNVALEVLESVLVEDDHDPAIRTVAALAAAGFSVELDDFGTGHASINNLLKMRVHRIKIDRAFVTALDRREESRKIVGGIVGLASSLGIQTLAEGVETTEEAAAARALGCELAQGFLIGRPMPREAAERWIRHWDAEAFMRSLTGDENAAPDLSARAFAPGRMRQG